MLRLTPLRSARTDPTPRTLHGPILVVAPHPDDETLGAGGLISHAAARGMPVWVLFVTSGDAFPWSLPHALARLRRGGRAQIALGEERMDEALLATSRLGVPNERVLFMGFPDRGMTALWRSPHDRPLRSSATGADRVPYDRALAPGAPYTAREFRRQFEEVIARVRPRTILTPGPHDGHGDHRAVTALVEQVWRQTPGVSLLYYLVHFGTDWPHPKGYRPAYRLRPPVRYGEGARWLTHALGVPHLRDKHHAIRAYATQLRVMAPTLWSFLRRNELLLPVERAPQRRR
ncbi:PIG-L deacetylase family protein [Deinococcus pimensis]|uniref:PIG-L deacetylase family protein n=1 Tax=Deinococcus pimensis TaxID=309888 RepID=UPI0004AECA0E|nr:PIG-L family deacetylase [Deinococcus pimensis]